MADALDLAYGPLEMKPCEMASMDLAEFWDFVDRRARHLEAEQRRQVVGTTQGDVLSAARERGLKVY